MCVILIKKRGVEMPSESELRRAYQCNPHGCGFVSSNGFYWRGMDFDEMMSRLKFVGVDDECMIHFRYATHGSHKPSNCHPFKIGDLYFAHNGVLPIRTKHDMTDSETIFRDVLAPAAELFGFGSKEFNSVINNNIWSSKFAFMYKGKIKFYGRWLREDNGLIWSNLNHRPFSSVTRGYNYTNTYDNVRAIFV